MEYGVLKHTATSADLTCQSVNNSQKSTMVFSFMHIHIMCLIHLLVDKSTIYNQSIGSLSN